MSKLPKLLEQTNLNSGNTSAFWLLRYNCKIKLIKALFAIIKLLNASIIKQHNQLEFIDTANVEHQDKYNKYIFYTMREFLISEVQK